MTIIQEIDKINNIKESVVTIGNFDGVHKGHQVLIDKAIQESNNYNCKSIVFTFSNHPINYFCENKIKNLMNNEEKIKYIKSKGVDIVISIPFDEYMTQISAKDFVKDILVDKLSAKKIIIGDDFKFARNKEGNVEILKKLGKEYGFEVEVILPIKEKSIRISSTNVRNLISEGEVEKVKPYLGRNYEIQGIVIGGKQLGRTIGFPTANLKIDEDILIPKPGIYATKVYIEDKVYLGATNIGYNPTVNGEKLTIETNIIDFNKDIYNQNIKLSFLERIRDEKKFSGLENLKEQLNKDINFIKQKYIYNIK